MVFCVVTSDSDIMPPFNFLHGLKLKTEAYKEVMLPRIKRMAAGRSYAWTLHHAIQAGEPSLGCQNVSVTTLPLTA